MVFLDTLKIGNKEYRVGSLKGWTHEIKESEDFREEKYYINLPYYNATIDERGFKVQFSLPKLVRGDNIFGVSGEYLKPAIRWIERDLRDRGVKVSLLGGRILRMDLFKNVETEYKFDSYSEVLRSLSLKRTFKRDYGDGFLMGNTLREICFYNKVKEVKENHEEGEKLIKKYGLESERMMRGELRFLTKVRSSLRGYPVDVVGEFIKAYEVVPVVYYEYMEKVFEKDFVDGKDVEFVFEERKRQALIDLAKYGRKALQWYGLEVYSYCSRDELKSALMECYKRSRVYAILREIEKEKEKFKGWRGKRFVELYQELKSKFLEQEGVLL